MLDSGFEVVVEVLEGSPAPHFWESHFNHVLQVLLVNFDSCFAPPRRRVHQVTKQCMSKSTLPGACTAFAVLTRAHFIDSSDEVAQPLILTKQIQNCRVLLTQHIVVEAMTAATLVGVAS